MNPYREPSADDASDRALYENAANIVLHLRAALTVLYLNEPYGGPRMNINLCAHGLGLADEEPPAWLLDALATMDDRT